MSPGVGGNAVPAAPDPRPILSWGLTPGNPPPEHLPQPQVLGSRSVSQRKPTQSRSRATGNPTALGHPNCSSTSLLSFAFSAGCKEPRGAPGVGHGRSWLRCLLAGWGCNRRLHGSELGAGPAPGDHRQRNTRSAAPAPANSPDLKA